MSQKTKTKATEPTKPQVLTEAEMLDWMNANHEHCNRARIFLFRLTQDDATLPAQKAKAEEILPLMSELQTMLETHCQALESGYRLPETL